MLKLSKILFPVEFHESCLRIIASVDFVARRFQSEIMLLHVLAPESYSPWERQHGQAAGCEDLLNDLRAFADKELHESLGPVFPGLAVRCLVQRGDPSTEIVDAAKREAVDLIAMPTRGRTGFFGRLIGSVTAEVMFDSDQPVLTGTHFPEAPAEGGVKHVLCGVTFSEHSRPTLTCAAKVAAEFQAKLTIAHVTPNVDLYGPGGTYADRGWQQELVRSAEELIAKVQAETGVKGEAAVGSGDPGAALSNIASQVGADLLVAGCHFGGGHLGANAQGILAESKIPVLSV